MKLSLKCLKVGCKGEQNFLLPLVTGLYWDNNVPFCLRIQTSGTVFPNGDHHADE